MLDKPLCWVGSSLEAVRRFPAEARRAAGYELGRVQQGLMPSDWKPMRTVGPGVIEIRVHTMREHRVFYVAKFEEAVYVLHAFEKRTRQTTQTDIVLARKRLAAVVHGRRGDEEVVMKTRMHRSSGNVFRDLGFAPAEAENLRLRSDLMIALGKLIESRGLTQVQAATLLGVSQPRISDLVRGKINRFSLDTLVAMLGHAGVRVRLVLPRRARVA